MTPGLFAIYVFNLFFITFLSIYGYKLISNIKLKLVYWPALFLKVLSGFLLGIFYFKYVQSGDTTLFYSRAMLLTELDGFAYFEQIFLTPIPYDQRSVLPISKILSLALLLTGSNYWLATVYFSLFGFFAAIFFLVKLQHAKPQLLTSAIVAVLFLPSMTFWSSGILKESLAFGLILIVSGIFLDYYYRSRLNIVIVLITVFLLWLLLVIKYYIAAVFIPLICLMSLISLAKKRLWSNADNLGYRNIYLILIAAGLLFAASKLQYNLDPSRVVSVIKENQQQVLVASGYENVIQYLDENEHSWYLIPNLAFANVSGLFRPIFPEVFEFPYVLVGLENLLFFVIFLGSIRSLIESKFYQSWLGISIATYIILLASLMAYSSPNYGTLTRLKVYYLPLFMTFCLYYNPIFQRSVARIKQRVFTSNSNL